MSADSLDNHSYERASDHTTEAQRRHYWAVAIGLQDVDDLAVSNYLRESARAYIEGEKALGEVGSLVREELVCPKLFDDPSLLRNIDPAKALVAKAR